MDSIQSNRNIYTQKINCFNVTFFWSFVYILGCFILKEMIFRRNGNNAGEYLFPLHNIKNPKKEPSKWLSHSLLHPILPEILYSRFVVLLARLAALLKTCLNFSMLMITSSRMIQSNKSFVYELYISMNKLFWLWLFLWMTVVFGVFWATTTWFSAFNMKKGAFSYECVNFLKILL